MKEWNPNTEQREAAEYGAGPVLVLGTPGSGKTTVIMHRTENLIRSGIRPENILIITFTRAAAESMRQRLKNPRVRICTFHSFFYWIMRTAYPNRKFLVCDEEQKNAMIRQILLSVNREEYDSPELVRSVSQQMDLISCDMIDLSNYYAENLPAGDFRRICRLYETRKEREGLVDFNDMISGCYRLLNKRKDILTRVHAMYPYIMADEFQDTNRIQYEIVKMIAGPENNFFAVGDDDQSIYHFRGARPDIMLSFPKEFPGSRIITLSKNYRCPAKIVQASDQLVRHNHHRYQKKLESAVSEDGTIRLFCPADVRTENDMIVSRIREQIRKGMNPGDMAVLYRTNISPRTLVYQLNDAGIPFEMRDQMPDLFTHFAVLPILGYLSFAAGDHSRRNFLTFMNKPVRYIPRDLLTEEEIRLPGLRKRAEGKNYLEQNLMTLSRDLMMIRKLPPLAAIHYIREVTGYETWLKKFCEERSIDFEEVQDVLDELEDISSHASDWQEFRQVRETYEKTREVRQTHPSGNALQLMTMHSAKGLEFTEVHILNCTEGEIPYRKAVSPEEREEERRMFYVAVTRTKRNLFLYAPKTIRDRAVRPSRFLKEMEGKHGTQ